MGHTTEVDTVKFNCQKVLRMDCFELTDVGAAGRRVGVGGEKELVLVVERVSGIQNFPHIFAASGVVTCLSQRNATKSSQ